MSLNVGFNYFAKLAGLTGNMQVFYPFISGNGSKLDSFPFAKTRFSGTISNTSSFYRQSGSGYFNGSTTLSINNSTGLNSATWTAILSYEQSGQQNGVLLSSYTSGNTNSGWLLGINETCSPYLEFYTANGPSISVSSNNWGKKNTILVTKTSNNLSFDYFDYNSKNFESESFIVDDSYFSFASNWILGGSTGTPQYFSGQRYKGFMDLFAFFSPAILPHQKSILSSGLYCDITNPAQQITSGLTNIVTGYQTGYVPIFSGTTGQSIVFYNYLTGDCGNITAKYAINDLTGVIYDILSVPLTRTIVHYFTGLTGGGPVENSGYSKSFGMDSISYLKNVDSSDLSELFIYPNVNQTSINNNLLFDRTLNKFILPLNYTDNQVNFYLNSVSQFISGYNVTGTSYSPGIELSGEAFISGNYLSGLNYFDDDTNIVDFISGDRIFNTGNYFIIGGQTGISGLGISNPNSLIFLNGIKLKSGLDYRLAGNNFILNDPYFYSITGNLWTFPRISGDIFVSGSGNNYQSSGFSRNTSQLWMNGVREFINQDYIELSKFSPLNNSSKYLSNLNSIYDNNGLFIE